MNEETIMKRMMEGNIQPEEAVTFRVYLAGCFSYYSLEYQEKALLKAQKWAEVRSKYNSDTSAERGWEKTPDGQIMANLKSRLKSIEKMMSALKTVIDSQVIDFHYTK